MKMEYLGHYNRENGNKQLLKEHLDNVSNLARKFSEAFGEGELAEIIGKYHDLGKYSKEFQEYILSGKKGQLRIDHSTAGAQLMMNTIPKELLPVIPALCIAGHHGGIPDLGSRNDGADDVTLRGRIKRKVPDIPNYNAYKEEISISELSRPSNIIKTFNTMDEIGLSLYVRMLYSCLVDADFLDTENFMSEGNVVREKFTSVDKLCEKITQYVAEKLSNPNNEINARRCQILHQCIKCGKESEKGLFSLTVPTGGGKTISSLAFALNNAAKNNMERVIYVIPYTSIIEQNAKVFADILGEDNILEHHMNIDYEDDDDDLDYKKKLATENWDAPIIVTTNVQFFESLFGNKPSKSRKLHNIANSVIIFDEAQMFPLEYLKACVFSIKNLVQRFNCTAVLCSATQPALNKFFNDVKSSLPVREIVDDTMENYKFFKRNSICRIEDKISKNCLADKLSTYKQVLCIVNKKITAQEVTASLIAIVDHDGVYHLSTNMYPVHRKDVLLQIRTRLKSNLPCIVVSTSLIEAGVDIDFPIVYRELTGLDSIIQSAGRCNREGKRESSESNVYIFELNDAGMSDYDNSQKAVCTLDVIRQYDDLGCEDAIKFYFDDLYNLDVKKLDKNAILKKSCNLSFKEVAKSFKLIKDNTVSVLVPDNSEAKNLAGRLLDGECNRKLLRASAMYSVNVYENIYRNLFEYGKVDMTDSGVAILNDMSCYDNQKGLIYINQN